MDARGRARAGGRRARRGLDRAAHADSQEGLALISSTDGMLGMRTLALHDLERLLKVADVTAAMSTEAATAPTAPTAA